MLSAGLQFSANCSVKCCTSTAPTMAERIQRQMRIRFIDKTKNVSARELKIEFHPDPDGFVIVTTAGGNISCDQFKPESPSWKEMIFIGKNGQGVADEMSFCHGGSSYTLVASDNGAVVFLSDNKTILARLVGDHKEGYDKVQPTARDPERADTKTLSERADSIAAVMAYAVHDVLGLTNSECSSLASCEPKGDGSNCKKL